MGLASPILRRVLEPEVGKEAEMPRRVFPPNWLQQLAWDHSIRIKKKDEPL